VPDAELFHWLTGASSLTENCNTPLFRRLRAFCLRTK
jgi:succinate dehydrogenase flavin-adding protein (antitoxin of CptAB toxin-antitoxin module)